MKKIIISIVVVIIVGGVFYLSQKPRKEIPTGPIHSGINGTVMLGPTCPVMRDPPDTQCADRPYETVVTVFNKSDPDHAVVFTQTAADGTFSFILPYGDYTLVAGEKMLPRCDHSEVTVRSGVFASTTISCDTGIR